MSSAELIRILGESVIVVVVMLVACAAVGAIAALAERGARRW